MLFLSSCIAKPVPLPDSTAVQNVPSYYYTTQPTVPQRPRRRHNPYEINSDEHYGDSDRDYVAPYNGGDNFEERIKEHELIYE